MIQIEQLNSGRHLNTSVWSRWLAFAMLAFGFLAFAASAASADTRSLRLYFVHTGEKAEIVYKRNGRYDQAGLQKINRLLRDWRRNEPTRMDPRLLDLVWEAYRTSRSRAYIHVICGYRSPATNSMLRSRSKGVANKSQHMLGKAMDFYIPDVQLKTLRNIGLRMQGGGVGYYPRSGSPFVHMDVGNVRHWPRMSRQELVSVFPNGKTLHVPSDGRPLPGFEQAVASYKARRGNGNLAIASAGGASGTKSRGFLAALFGGGADEEEDTASSTVVAAVPARKAAPETTAQKPVKVAEQKPRQPERPAKPGILIVPPEMARPAEIRPAEAVEEPAVQAPETIVAALPKRDVPVPGQAPRPQAVVVQQPETVPFQVVPGGDEPAEQPTQVALGIPLPTHRPDYTPTAEAASGEDEVATLLAMAEPVASDAPPSIPMPFSRPEDEEAELSEEEGAADDLVVAALPESRPSLAPTEEPQLAAYAPNEAPGSLADGPFGISPADAGGTAGRLPAKGARVAAAPTPKSALAEKKPRSNPSAAIASGVKTTAKSARPASGQSKPEPKPVVVSAEPQTARWALHTNSVALNAKGATGPAFAYNIVRTAPREVYTAGFQQASEATDTKRFSGKAVTFLSVARFETN